MAAHGLFALRVILFAYSAEQSWLNARPVAFASLDLPAIWRVVFSSTGDLVPASLAVRYRGLLPRGWTPTLLRPLRSVLDGFFAVLLPSDCRICDAPLAHISRIPVCEDCVSSLAPTQINACSICGEALEFANVEAGRICPVCQRALPRFDFAVSYGSYDGALRRLVHLLKYEQLRPAADMLGQKLADALIASGVASDDKVLIVPVPLHKAKRRQRGFNQTELLAKSALRHLDRSCFELQTGNLHRVRATVSQTGLTRHQRRENVRGAFVVGFPERVRDRSVLIVDDVYTTGTTLNECARVLRAAGAKRVVVATVARVYRSVEHIPPDGRYEQEETAAVADAAVA